MTPEQMEEIRQRWRAILASPGLVKRAPNAAVRGELRTPEDKAALEVRRAEQLARFRAHRGEGAEA